MQCELQIRKDINKIKVKGGASEKISCFSGFLKDLEEELDMKDRVIKKLQDQVKTLTKTIEKGRRGMALFFASFGEGTVF